MARGPTYWDYLKLDRLLGLQGGLEDDESELMPDELHFIVVHQAFELWFKLMVRELRVARDHLAAPLVPEEKIPFVVHHLNRVSKTLALIVEQFGVMETLTPQDFLAFRDKLVPASGFQSFQLRELEILLGLEDSQRLSYGETDPLQHIEGLAKGSPAGELAMKTLKRARSELSVKNALGEWLFRTPVQGSSPGEPNDDGTVLQFLTDYFQVLQKNNVEKTEHLIRAIGTDPAPIRRRVAEGEEHARRFLFAEDAPPENAARLRRIRAGVLFIESYRELPLLAWPRLLIDTVVEMEEQLVLFRTRHARMVERIIGRRVGTGGSSGVDYLDQTTRYRIFDDLWTVRTILLPKELLPELARREVYGFAR